MTSLPATPDGPAQPAPVTAAKRIDSLDVLRGFAVLGILIMNIQSFGLPMAAYFNPTVAGGFDGHNYWIWVVGHLLADLKFMTIFSMLFGAGIVLFTSRVEARGKSSLGLQYRRLLWLLIIGMIHGYLLWLGDILFYYAVCGFLVFWLRKWRPGTLVVAAIASLMITTGITAFSGFYFSAVHDAVVERDQAIMQSEAGDGATPNDPIVLGAPLSRHMPQYEQMRDEYDPPQKKIDEEVEAMTGSWLDEITYRAPKLMGMQTMMLIFYAWRVIGAMLLGMALFKWGVVSAARSTGWYIAAGVLGFGIGVPLVWMGFQGESAAGSNFVNAKFIYSHYNYYGSLFVAMGWISVIMLLCKSNLLHWLKASLGAVGRMAFTNYIMHTVVATTIFNGRSGLGLGYFNEFDRGQLLIVVVSIFIFQMIASPIWLRYYRFGPLEWLWRCLTYWKLQPMKRTDIAAG